MTFQEIDELTIESALPTLIERVLDTSVVPKNAPLFMLDKDLSKLFYERVIFHQNLVKPSLVILEAELQELKNELTDIERARIDEINRVADIRSRFNAISDIRGALNKAGLKIGNPALELKRIIEENDQFRLSALESAFSEFEAEQNEAKQKKEEMKIANALVDICLECVKIVMKHNIKNGLSKEQKDQQALDYSDLFDSLSKWRPGKLKSSISATTPDGVLVKQDLKDELLNFLSESGI